MFCREETTHAKRTPLGTAVSETRRLIRNAEILETLSSTLEWLCARVRASATCRRAVVQSVRLRCSLHDCMVDRWTLCLSDRRWSWITRDGLSATGRPLLQCWLVESHHTTSFIAGLLLAHALIPLDSARTH